MIEAKKIENFSAIELIIEGERVLIETKYIKEILIPEEEIIPVPFSRKSIIGIIDVRGELYTIISLSKILFKATKQDLIENKPILLVDLDGLKLGLLVDSVFDVHNYSKSIFEKKDLIHKTEIDPKFIKEMGFSNGDSLILLELNSIVQTFFLALEEKSTASIQSDIILKPSNDKPPKKDTTQKK